jgi:FKBP-type peptidyl-prolyl cis-trans isomerase (trigger factor)
MSVLINSDTEIGYQVEELARWRRRLAVQVPVHAAQRVHEQTVRDFAKRARLKGFRRGKAPTQIVERQYGPEIDQEVLKRLVQEGFEQACATSPSARDSKVFDVARRRPRSLSVSTGPRSNSVGLLALASNAKLEKQPRQTSTT